MNSLLETISFDSTIKHTRRGARHPLMMEFSVNPELAPFLVSSTRSLQWVPAASQSGHIKAAVRKRQNLESEIVAAILHMGQEAEWGNVHPLTTEGIQACVDHLAYYDLTRVEILVAPDTDMGGVTLPEGHQAVEARWMPQDAAVVVPVERGFLGTLGTLGQHKAVAVVHNASRGAAVAWR